MQSRPEICEIDALILCGGKGQRLRNVVNDRPKPLAEICGRPFLDILIDFSAGFGFRRFILLAGHMGDSIKHYAAEKKKLTSLAIETVIEPAPLGTGGAVKNAGPFLKSASFLLLNGDSICPANLSDFLKFHNEKRSLATIMLSIANEAKDYGLVTVDCDDRISSFQEKSDNISGGYVNAGIYLFDKAFLDLLPEKPCSLEQDVFPKIIGNNLYGYVTNYPHLDIGTPERYFKAQNTLSSLIYEKETSN